MRRRAFLLDLAALAAIVQSDLVRAGEPVRQLLEVTLMSEPRSIDDWALACNDHLHGLRTRPPAQVRDDLIVDLLSINHQLKTSDDQNNVELHRITAALSTLHANVLTRLGDHGAAIRWWSTARAAADQSGDLELRLGVRATEAGHGLYGQRAPDTVLRLTQNAQQIAGSAPSLGLALIACSQAKALTLLGRHTEAVRALNVYCDLAVSAPEPSGVMPGYWKAGHLRFAENMVYAGAGDESKASRAQGYVLASANPDYQVSTQVYLHDALCTVVNGGIDEGINHATEILDSVAPKFRSHMITETGKTVLRAVPPEQQQRPAVREFRKMLTTGKSPESD
jgi:hypothetical protein